MNLYAHDLSLLDYNLNFSDPILEPFSNSATTPYPDDDDSVGNHKGNFGNDNNDINKQRVERTRSPPRHRHDGTSPLPLGMDWSPPPRKWVLSLFFFDPLFNLFFFFFFFFFLVVVLNFN